MSNTAGALEKRGVEKRDCVRLTQIKEKEIDTVFTCWLVENKNELHGHPTED